METAAVIVHIVVSLVIIVAVLLQSGKGASMGSSFGGSTSSQAVFGSAGPATLLIKVTAVCAVIFMATSLYITYKSGHQETDSIMMDVPAVNIPSASDAVPDPLAPAKEDTVSPAATAPEAAPADAGALKETKKTDTTAPSAEEPKKK